MTLLFYGIDMRPKEYQRRFMWCLSFGITAQLIFTTLKYYLALTLGLE